jgi:hypothetical protein
MKIRRMILLVYAGIILALLVTLTTMVIIKHYVLWPVVMLDAIGLFVISLVVYASTVKPFKP